VLDKIGAIDYKQDRRHVIKRNFIFVRNGVPDLPGTPFMLVYQVFPGPLDIPLRHLR
jgi:hypothetical protein